ncbi:hypothetical protein QWJ34_23270 [Saccharibacillus sp. CPCC 101409]|uniref:hypothetical protein n=1 Tax=Saccharibacillus sp. CPCC 101409 TaxID=3058041 RepID=UPI0026737EE5|nr:hypothetical protein [Saccharibacillus sp. CPCC 101409]MDO3412707.1 hypothetical protein [Saccharibacillus sp. CPCC 101409]
MKTLKYAKNKPAKTESAVGSLISSPELPSKKQINLKRIWIIGTLALGITLGSGFGGGRVEAEAVYRETPPASADNNHAGPDAFLHALGAAAEQDVYELMYEGLSLREIAVLGGGSEEQLIALQVRELEQQLEERLQGGRIGKEAYIAYKAELPEIVAKSIAGE